MLQTYWGLSASPSVLKGRDENIMYAQTVCCWSVWIIKQSTVEEIDSIQWISNWRHIYFLFLVKIYFHVCSLPNSVLLKRPLFA